jgi:iron-sulfur cluster assembly accessory protein
MITLTEKAAEQVKKILSDEKMENAYLRVQVVGGGCSGMSYKLGFEETPAEKDRAIESNGVKVLIDPKSALYLNGITVDYEGGLNGTGFQFVNPNAKKSCGCGTSFSA